MSMATLETVLNWVIIGGTCVVMFIAILEKHGFFDNDE